MKNLAVYLHWPFCQSKCPYCDFASKPVSKTRGDESVWTKQILEEWASLHERLPNRKITSVYFGGGTPSLLLPQTIALILRKIGADSDAEITLEANPVSSDAEKFRAFRDAGVNRLSLGVQALNDVDLKFLGRLHNVRQAREALESAAKIFPRFSFDLIYARRGQTVRAWEEELQEALGFGAKHLSLYQLTIEKETAFGNRERRGETLTSAEEIACEMLALTYEKTECAGVPFYEVSNFAAAGEESRHNLAYWNYDDYVGLGPAAHGRISVDGTRFATENTTDFDAWFRSEGRQETVLLEAEAKVEALLMGLRLRKGIDRAAWKDKFGEDILESFDVAKIRRAEEEGLVFCEDPSVRATTEGFRKLNALIEYVAAKAT